MPNNPPLFLHYLLHNLCACWGLALNMALLYGCVLLHWNLLGPGDTGNNSHRKSLFLKKALRKCYFFHPFSVYQNANYDRQQLHDDRAK